jgi:hypothetical protein
MKIRWLHWINGLGFLGTEIILLSLVESSVIREWVFFFININLILYMYDVRKTKRRLSDYETASKDPSSKG